MAGIWDHVYRSVFRGVYVFGMEINMNQESNVVGGPLDGEYRSPADEHGTGFYHRDKGNWYFYSWDEADMRWFLAGVQKPVLGGR